MSEQQLRDRLIIENNKGNLIVKGDSLEMIKRINKHKLILETTCSILPFRTALTIKSGI